MKSIWAIAALLMLGLVGCTSKPPVIKHKVAAHWQSCRRLQAGVAAEFCLVCDGDSHIAATIIHDPVAGLWHCGAPNRTSIYDQTFFDNSAVGMAQRPETRGHNGGAIPRSARDGRVPN